MIIREKRQKEAVEAFLRSDRRTIINACPRFGKIKVALDIMLEMALVHPLILAPRKDIFQGWRSDFRKFGLPSNPTYCTFTSIKSLQPGIWDLVIIDEPHELSVNQQKTLALYLQGSGYPILGLTGTLTNKTKNELYDNLNLDTCYTYTIDQGVSEGILADYKIIVHKVQFSNVEKNHFGKMKFALHKASDPKATRFITLKMINSIQNSITKRLKTIELINRFKDERLLVFCGVTEVADNLGIPVYHSKKREEDIFRKFCDGEGMHLATIKMMQAGITVSPISKGIINYMSGNPEDSAQKICRFLGFEYSNPDKKAEIHIVSSNDDFELDRLKTGLMFFDKSKITI